MKITHRAPLPLMLILTATLATPALASDRDEATERGSSLDPDISHIEGQLVPVGRHNEYRYSFPRWNVASNPLLWLTDIYGISLSHAVSDHIALRGDVTVTNFSEADRVGYQLSANAPIYFRRAYQGLYLEPGVTIRRGDSSRSRTTFGPHVLAGWHWIWDSGLNASVAFGLGRDLNAERFDSDIFPAGYLNFGFAF
jgi:hypothetical protein